MRSDFSDIFSDVYPVIYPVIYTVIYTVIYSVIYTAKCRFYAEISFPGDTPEGEDVFLRFAAERVVPTV